MIISFSSKPNLPGQDIFLVRVASHRRPTPAEVAKVILRFAYLEEDLGTVYAAETAVVTLTIEPDTFMLFLPLMVNGN